MRTGSGTGYISADRVFNGMKDHRSLGLRFLYKNEKIIVKTET